MRVHWSLWLVGVIALVWHGMSVMNLFMQMSEARVAAMPEPFRTIVGSRPLWATFAFALSGIAGVLGALALLLRHRICGPLFFFSFLGTLFTVLQTIIAGALSSLSAGLIVLTVLGPVVLGFFLIVFSHRARKRGWLKGTQPVE